MPPPAFWEVSYSKWLAAMEQRGASRATMRSYADAVRRFVRWSRTASPRDVTREKIEEYRGDIVKRGFSVETVHLYLRGVRRFFEWLVESGDLLADPTEGVEFPRRPRVRVPKVLTEEEMERVLAAARNPRDRAILEVLYATGLRVGELCALDVGDVEDDAVRVRAGKGGAGRVVPLTAEAARRLEEYIREVRPRWAKCDALWVGPKGGRLSAAHWTQIIRGYGATTHAIRRTVATLMLRRGASPVVVKELLGHVGMRRLPHYIRVAAADLKKAHEEHHPRP